MTFDLHFRPSRLYPIFEPLSEVEISVVKWHTNNESEMDSRSLDCVEFTI